MINLFRKEQSFNAYCLEKAGNRNHDPELFQSLKDFIRFLNQTHLSGKVYQFDESHFHFIGDRLVFDKQPVELPTIDFKPINSADQGLSNEREIPHLTHEEITPFADRFRNSILYSPKPFTNDGFLPWECFYGHCDLLSNYYSLGILLARIFFEEPSSILQIRSGQKLFLPNAICEHILQLTQPKRSLRMVNASVLEDAISKMAMTTMRSFTIHELDPYYARLKILRDRLLEFNAGAKIFNVKDFSAFLAIAPNNDEISTIQLKWIFETETGDFDRLNRLRLEKMRNEREKGFSNLLLVIAVLNWFDPKDPATRYSTPFLLKNADLQYKKGINQQFQIEAVESVLTVNEVLRYYFHRHFSLNLPPEISANQEDIFALIESINQKLSAEFSEITIGSNRENDWQLESENWFLGIFEYRSIGLIKDYDVLLASDPIPSVTRLIGDSNQDFGQNKSELYQNPGYLVLPADPSQQNVVFKSAIDHSFCVEGPPGTGKSQTIVNILAQALAKKKKVLFVSSKRAALDVVYNRLKSTGLDSLTAIIHESRRDKKEFISQLANNFNILSRRVDRNFEILRELRKDAYEDGINAFYEYDKLTRDRTEGVSINECLFIYSQLSPHADISTDCDWTFIPDFSLLKMSENDFFSLKHLLHKYNSSAVYSQNAFGKIAHFSFLFNEKPENELKNTIENISSYGKDWKKWLQEQKVQDGFQQLSIGDLAQISALCKTLSPLALKQLVRLVDSESRLSAQFDKLAADFFRKKKTRDNRFVKTALGGSPPALHQVESALKNLQNQTDLIEVRQFVQDYFVFDSPHFINDYETILNQYLSFLKAEENMESLVFRFRSLYQIEKPEEFIYEVSLLRSIVQRTKLQIPDFFELLFSLRLPDRFILSILEMDVTIQKLVDTTRLWFNLDRDHSVTELMEAIAPLHQIVVNDNLLAIFQCVNQLPKAIQQVLSNSNLTIDQIWYLSLKKKVDSFFNQYDEWILNTKVSEEAKWTETRQNLERYFAANANYIVDINREDWLEKVALSLSPANQLKPEQRTQKQVLKKGISILKHEFGKKTQHKTAFELLNSDASQAINGMVGLWMMSPFTVSDTFPLEQTFDLVVFDEASQLETEQCIPVIARSKQLIVVGDSMQLPPSRFFKQNHSADPDSLSATLLSLASTNLNSEWLQWHYRSSHSDLIAFSNHAFYRSKLKLLPLPHRENVGIVFHRIEGVFENRRNVMEAKEVAKELRNSMISNPNLGHAVIAFSLTQQEEIEREINFLRQKDEQFRLVYEQNLVLTNGDEDCGFICRNLENMQGEERDIVFLSIGYGADGKGYTRLNFGPVSQAEGYKRLNVAITRSRIQMRVFCSLNPEEINSETNESIEFLGLFLQYAEACSNHDLARREFLLQALNRKKNFVSDQMESDFVIYLKRILSANGIELMAQKEISNQSAKMFRVAVNGVETKHLVYLEGYEADALHDFLLCGCVLKDKGWIIHRISHLNFLRNSKSVIQELLALNE